MLRAPFTLLAVLALLLVACDSAEAPAAAPTEATAAATAIEVAAPAATASTATPTATAATAPEPTASTGAIPREALPLIEFVRADGTTVTLPVEVLPRDEFAIGLSGRPTLDERGMLFDYGIPDHDGPFWMQNTHFDLAIAFIDADQRIVSIKAMRAETQDLVYSDAPYQYAIEAPAGWYAAQGIAEGDGVRFQFDPPSAAS